MKPENGIEVIATGRIGTYADRSKYQLVIDRLEFAGEGALLARIEMLRKRLLEEGLFDLGMHACIVHRVRLLRCYPFRC